MKYMPYITIRKPDANPAEPFEEWALSGLPLNINRAKITARVAYVNTTYAINGFIEDANGERVWSTEEEEIAVE